MNVRKQDVGYLLGPTPTALRLTGSLSSWSKEFAGSRIDKNRRWPSCIKNALTDASTGDFTYAFRQKFLPPPLVSRASRELQIRPSVGKRDDVDRADFIL